MKEFESCEKCKYSSKSYYEYPCEICVHGCAVKEYYVPMTNADRIRGMTDEGLADFICSVKPIISGLTKIIQARKKPENG